MLGVKDELHLFERPALSLCVRAELESATADDGRDVETNLFDEEPYVYHECPVKDSKHQKCPPFEVVDGMRRNLGEDKVEQPLCGRTHGHATFANTVGENLSRVELG